MTIPIPRFEKAKILVVGDIMLDRYWTGETNRISPEAPVPVVRVDDIEDRLGGAANVAQNIAALGCETMICGALGDDEAGQKTKTLLKASQIDNISVELHERPTITKLRIMSRHQQLIRMDFEKAAALNTSQNNALIQQITQNLHRINAVVLSDYAKGTLADPQSVIQLCREKQVPVLVDPKGADFSRYRGATLITPNFSELETAVGPCPDLTTAFTKAQEICHQFDINGVLITLSERGMALVEKDKAPLHVPTAAKDVFDVTGAGDTVIATLSAAIASGTPNHSAIRLANLAAGVVVGKLGTATVSKAELTTALQINSRNLSKGETTLVNLQQQVMQCREQGEKIVFTNGCFDLLHAGHVRYLQKAAALGDRLIVGMNSDNSIKRLKGAERPIVTLAERMEVISALACVDWVIPFDEDTPITLINALSPDILSKGGDYKAEEIVGYKEVTENGGSVEILPFVDGCSTTTIVEKIKRLPS